MKNNSSTIKIVEVGARDGLQNEKINIPTDIKLQFIDKLVKAGITTIEATSFVSPRWVPQMADHDLLLSTLMNNKLYSGIHFPVLVPNIIGLDNAIKSGVKEIAVFGSASESFSQKNINCSIEESIERFKQVINKAKTHNIVIRGYVSCALGCPYEGEISPKAVIFLAKKLYELGCYEISIGDTIGVGTPLKAKNLFKLLTSEIPAEKLAMHFHDTYGQALANIYACLENNITVIDSSTGGLGGCPYAVGASGNVATEDVLYLLDGLNIKTNIQLESVIKAGLFISQHLDHPPRSKLAQVYLGKKHV